MADYTQKYGLYPKIGYNMTPIIPNQKNLGIIRKIRIKRSENRPDFPSYRDNYTQTLRDNPGAQKKGLGIKV